MKLRRVHGQRGIASEEREGMLLRIGLSSRHRAGLRRSPAMAGPQQVLGADATPYPLLPW